MPSHIPAHVAHVCARGGRRSEGNFGPDRFRWPHPPDVNRGSSGCCVTPVICVTPRLWTRLLSVIRTTRRVTARMAASHAPTNTASSCTCLQRRLSFVTHGALMTQSQDIDILDATSRKHRP